jgi:hypothetical protein
MTIAKILRDALDSQVRGWKAERDSLQNRIEELKQAEARLAELDALIAEAEDDSKESFQVAKREKPVIESPDKLPSGETGVEEKTPVESPKPAVGAAPVRSG